MENLDDIDRKLLNALQEDASLSLDALGETASLSRNACWRRIKALEERGIIRARRTELDPVKLGLGLQVYMLVRATRHDPDWLDDFRRATKAMPEILGVYRMSGDLDYLLRARLRDIADYDRLYQRLIAQVPLGDVSASFVMEEIKDTQTLPL